MMHSRKMKLGAFLNQAGHHVAAWLHPETPSSALKNQFGHFIEMSQLAERGLFDLVFWADSSAAWGPTDIGLECRTLFATRLEPLTLLSAVSVVTRHIGLVATSTTTYDEPYLVARKFASLDEISGGRAGWNLVTSSNTREAENFGRTTHVPHDQRYERASEFADVVLGLWDSWDYDAFVHDRSAALFYDPYKRHDLNHVGKFFSVKGPLNIARSPQGRPVMVQAGSSGPGRELASRTADVVFTVQQDLKQAKSFAADIKTRAQSNGRDPASVVIMPGLVPIIEDTKEKARAKLEALDDLVPPEMGVALLSTMVGLDLSGFPLDGPLPEVPPANASQGRQKVAVDLARRENLTIRQLYRKLVALRGHLKLVGTAVEIADTMEEWFEAGAADGFNVMPALAPSGFQEFIDQVIPELQRRGLFRTSYEGSTLRENLGLSMPVSRYAPGGN